MSAADHESFRRPGADDHPAVGDGLPTPEPFGHPAGRDAAREIVVSQTDDDQIQIELTRRGGTFCFRYAPGDESQLIKTLLRMARDPASPLDPFDAAVLTQRIGREMGRKLRQMIRN